MALVGRRAASELCAKIREERECAAPNQNQSVSSRTSHAPDSASAATASLASRGSTALDAFLTVSRIALRLGKSMIGTGIDFAAPV